MRFKLVVFDVDGTLTQDNVWPLLHQHMGVHEHLNKEKIQEFKEKKLSYEDWVKHDIELWQSLGANKQKLMQGIKHFKLIDGAMETIQELKKKGYKLAIISGTINIVLEHIFPDFEKYFDYAFFNKILFDDEGNIIGHDATPYDHDTKAEGLKMITEKEGINISESIFIGDNNNDIDIAKLAGFSIAFNCKSEELAKVADIVIESKDMRNILDYIQ